MKEALKVTFFTIAGIAVFYFFVLVIGPLISNYFGVSDAKAFMIMAISIVLLIGIYTIFFGDDESKESAKVAFGCSIGLITFLLTSILLVLGIYLLFNGLILFGLASLFLMASIGRLVEKLFEWMDS